MVLSVGVGASSSVGSESFDDVWTSSVDSGTILMALIFWGMKLTCIFRCLGNCGVFRVGWRYPGTIVAEPIM